MSEENLRIARRKAALYFFVVVIMFVLTYIAFYVQAQKPGGSDTTVHMGNALSFDLVMRDSHCGWHFVCWLLYACLPITIEEAAAAATALFNACTAALLIWFGEKYMDRMGQEKIKLERWKAAVIPLVTLVSMLVGPLYLRFYNRRYYLGQGSPNPWHNPTSTAVRPFMIPITVLTVGYWCCGEEETVTVRGKTLKKTTAYQLVLGVLLLISTVIKPSYLMVYLPVCGVRALACLFRSRGRGFWKLVAQHLYFIPSLCVFLYQYLILYFLPAEAGAEEAGVVIAFFRAVRMHAPSVTVSLLLRMAFPFLVIFLWRKEIFKEWCFPLVFGQYIAGLLISWTFAETGRRASHGNFGWGNILACFLLWAFCLFFFAKRFLEDKERIQSSRRLKARYGVLFSLLVWHLAGGICFYLIQV